jgi:hypothetical protein
MLIYGFHCMNSMNCEMILVMEQRDESVISCLDVKKKTKLKLNILKIINVNIEENSVKIALETRNFELIFKEKSSLDHFLRGLVLLTGKEEHSDKL